MVAIILAIVLGGIILIGFIIKKYADRNKDYWDKRGVSNVKGNNGAFMTLYYILSKKKNILDFDRDSYVSLGTKPYGGSVDFGTPALLIKDPELIKQILVKDFDHFVDRRKVQMHSEKKLNLMVSTLEGQEWKNVRAVMSPTFTTGKIRRMFEHFNKCGAHLVEFVKSKPVGSPGTRDIVVKEAFSRYLVDIIGATAFGMETNSLKDPNSKFYKMSKRQSEFSLMKLAKVILAVFVPFLTRFGLRLTDSEAMDFFENICKTALRNRENSTEKREDFLQMMIETRRGELKTDESELDSFEKNAQLSKPADLTAGKAKVILTDDMITAQSMLFFLAGLDTTGSVLCFAAYLLALHPDIQTKLFEEVHAAMKENGGEVDYDSVLHMEYMDKFISEILRMYPPGTRVERRCTKDYKLADSNFTIEKDTIVFMTVHAMHHDPAFYPDPEKFDPERFTPEEKAKRNPYTYLPFGIGMRFALMEAKVAIAYLVYNFSIEPCESTPVPIKVDPNLGSRPIVELELRFKARNP